MSRTASRLLGAAAAVVLLALLAFGYFAYRVSAVGAGFAAKNACSTVFVSRRDVESARADLRAYRSVPLDLVGVEVDPARRAVTARFLGVVARTAVHREGLGCVLALDAAPEALRHIVLVARTRPDAPWPAGDGDAPPTVSPALAAALDRGFADPAGAPQRRTRAVVVVHRGRIAAERYAPGFDRDTALPGWSMAKSITAALVGTLVGEGRLALDRPLTLAAWAGSGDPRGRITLAQLLHMSSGLEFGEQYANPLSDVVTMLFGTADAAGFAAAKPLAHFPGTRWSYASGTTNIVMRAVRETLGEAYHEFPRRALFDRIGMTSAVFETDASGTYVGSSFLYATARDWARFGMLVLDDGRWRGERLLPAGWVRFMASAAPAAPEREYGAHWWLQLDANRGPQAAARRLPPDAFHASGHGGQFITVVPSRAVVVVRLGHAVGPGEYQAWNQDAFAADVLDALAR